MILSPSVRTTLLVCSAACWVLTARLSTETLFSHKQPHVSGGAQTSFLFPSFALVDTALAHRAPPAFPPYTGGFEEPFKSIREARRPAATSGTAKTAITPARPKLMLKGILLKSNPLSILQDENGRTFILGIGDTLQGQRVVLIGKSSVTLSDKHGSYDLSVKE